MGVIYKLKDEVVQFIISQRQDNPLFSCRQLAESASEKFGLHLSKSSVHDVLKESGIITPRGRKPKEKFKIPQEKKKQIQTSLSQVKLLPVPADAGVSLMPDVVEFKDSSESPPQEIIVLPPPKEEMEISAEYEGAGKVFLKAIRWDLGIFSEEDIKESDWDYYLTYSKGIKVVLENDTHFFIDLPLPIERCVRETVDGLVNNVKPLIIHKVSDEKLLKACMDAEPGFKIRNISIVVQNDHIILEINDIMEFKRNFIIENRLFMESNERTVSGRIKAIFFPQTTDNDGLIENILNLKGCDTTNKDGNIVSILIDDSYNNKILLQEAVEKLNGMYLRDEENRLVQVKILSSQG